ncbi:copper resistance protein crd2 [Colletotrichum tofieldiae]|nr:copper resistance protein crd2 [Colletotrichum tofieldiae]
MFLLANLVGIRDERIIAWILEQYEGKPFPTDINIVVGELQPEAPKQTAEDAIEATADESHETSGKRRKNRKKRNNKGQGRNNGQQARAPHNVGTQKPRFQRH